MVKTYLEEDFGSLLQEFNTQTQSFEEGSILKGVIVSIDDKVVGVDIGSKSIGYIPVTEFKDENVQLNDIVDILLNKIENKKGDLLISHANAKKIQTWNNLKQYINDATVVEGKILGKVKGGFAIELNGVIAFLPKSQINSADLTNINGLIGQKDKFVVLKVDDSRGNVVVSKRAIMDEERLKERAEILSKIEVGNTLDGIVKNLTDYGAFIDFGGFDGLLHLTDISWCRIRHPSDVLKVGQEVKVQVIKYDSETKKVSLGMKQLQENPWNSISEKYPAGKITRGKVTSIAQYGVFIEIDNGIEGLVHISEISWFKNNLSPAKILSVGQEIDVMVLEIDTEHHRISLGIKQTTPNPWKIFADAHEIGDILEGVVKNSTDFGLFVELDGNLDALLHISDLEREEDIKKYNKGDKVEVVLLSTDYEQERIAVGVKQLRINLKEEIKKYSPDVDVKAVVKLVKKDLLEVEVENTQLKAIIKRTYLSKDKKDQKTDKFKISEIVEGKIYIFDAKTGKFEISLKPLNQIVEGEDEEDVSIDQYTGQEVKKDTLGSVFSSIFANFDK
ncbi:MAG: 30S ribosomal protein S1 [Rickettsiales bacterium]|nr:MAG: 30S ribosomal protein S1 [Rickettsiales bacterium]